VRRCPNRSPSSGHSITQSNQFTHRREKIAKVTKITKGLFEQKAAKVAKVFTIRVPAFDAVEKPIGIPAPK
jgi:hypothetical protein